MSSTASREAALTFPRASNTMPGPDLLSVPAHQDSGKFTPSGFVGCCERNRRSRQASPEVRTGGRYLLQQQISHLFQGTPWTNSARTSGEYSQAKNGSAHDECTEAERPSVLSGVAADLPPRSYSARRHKPVLRPAQPRPGKGAGRRTVLEFVTFSGCFLYRCLRVEVSRGGVLRWRRPRWLTVSVAGLSK
jgi:hypothetical protein